MQTVRRVYLYLVSAVSLAMLAWGVATLLQSLLFLVSQTAAAVVREQVARAVGVTLVALIVWTVHWTLATRLAARDPSERAAALRRLFLYGTLALAMIALAYNASHLVRALAAALASLPVPGAPHVFELLPALGVAAVIWGYHWTIAARDREAVGETAAAATLRRWYSYGTAFWALLLLLTASATLVRFFFALVVGSPAVGGQADVIDAVGPALVGLLIWAGQWSWTSAGPIGDDDRRSVLRTVYLLAVIGVAVVMTLVQAGQVLFVLISRLLGVAAPGGLPGSLPQLLAGPFAVALVYGTAWVFHLRALRHTVAGAEDSPRRRGVRRLYRYLVALVALGLLAVGLAGMLWTIGDLLTSATLRESGTWREQLSFFVTLGIVAFPVWLVVWRPRVDPSEASSLSRRLYLYLGLIGAVLAALIAGAAAVYQFAALALAVRLPVETLPDLVRALAVLSVSAGVAGYQWRILRIDAERAPRAPQPVVQQARLCLIAPDGQPVRELTGDLATLRRLFDRVAAETARSGSAPPGEPSPLADASP
ncbi:MAG: DUF5671 domain-containing protein [Chloroflexota bacterium]|nr:DUF5671 domain-containing protein [Dehalococcoidia bacterium]MDW8254116.1 DUF5671 domain-containing protein [Chloroflexota bacterium]